ncbi:MAG: response regulator [Chelatococcus sp.]|nr:response regulator [Chelatococcus sp.]
MGTHRAPPRPVVLVVEDDAFQLMTAVDMAADAGFEVLEAHNADEAIAILESRSDIRIIFTDVEMPGSMDGLKLAAAVRDRWPPVEIIVTSGKGLPDDWTMPERGAFFPKPYDSHRVLAKMREFAG